jgi:hypothetical protein
VKQCKVSECGYNRDKACHALAITIGSSDNPICGAYFKSSTQTSTEQIAGVGSCKVSSCFHNADFECHAEGIAVDKTGGNAVCTTFSRR